MLIKTHNSLHCTLQQFIYTSFQRLIYIFFLFFILFLADEEKEADGEGDGENSKKKRKRKKKKGGAGGGEGGGEKTSEEGALGKSGASKKQTDPPTVPISELFPEGVYPEGQVVEHPEVNG